MAKTITQINQQVLKELAKYPYITEDKEWGLGGLCEAIKNNIDQAQPVYVEPTVCGSQYLFVNGIEGLNPEVDHWIKDQKDREFYISQAEVEGVMV